MKKISLNTDNSISLHDLQSNFNYINYNCSQSENDNCIDDEQDGFFIPMIQKV